MKAFIDEGGHFPSGIRLQVCTLYYKNTKKTLQLLCVML